MTMKMALFFVFCHNKLLQSEQCMFLYCELLAASLYSVLHENVKNKTEQHG
jgi:hypothetical protein